MSWILAIDQGTTSSRAILFDADLKPRHVAQEPFPQIFPASGWVEHDPEAIWDSTLSVCRAVLKEAQVDAGALAGVGITNQRETTLVWDRKTGEPLHNAIVWQDRRTSALCQTLKDAGSEPQVTDTTGLLLDPYFSATKVRWILDTVDGARRRAAAGELCFGTVDSYLIWRLTGGKRHVTDATNASRTMLYDIHRGAWSDEMCALFDVPMSCLPEVLDCAAEFGTTEPGLLGGAVPILGVAGDQQAAAIGQACFEPGMVKSTYGTGCFALLNTGTQAVRSENRLLTTLAWSMDGQANYALEGSIFIAGAVVQWLRDGLGVIGSAGETADLAASADAEQGVVLVPAFTGLGAPYWNAECRGAIYGLTRNTGPAELARAALESVAYQTRDLVEAMTADWPGQRTVLRVDGGLSANDWAMQALADTLGSPVDRPVNLETTATGAAWLAGYRAGLYPDAATTAKAWEADRRFGPALPEARRDHGYARWKKAIDATLRFADTIDDNFNR